MQSFFRYPGGKAKFKDIIVGELQAFADYTQYREPFFGGGSIGLNMVAAPYPPSIWINDKDIGIAALWQSVAQYPDELKEKITSFTPSVAAFDEMKAFFLASPRTDTVDQIVQAGFNKLALHQLSFSGLGMKSGGPLGGRKQDEHTKYPIDCRWSPMTMIKKITKLHEAFSRKQITITHGDFAELITDSDQRALIYLDPPYYEKGGELYHHAFNDADHARLSQALQATPHDWVLSYDAVQPIRDLYDWATVIEIDANYTINTSTKKKELLIFKPGHAALLAKLMRSAAAVADQFALAPV